MDEPAESGSARALCLLVALFLALRLALVLTAVESVSYDEELYRGVIAKELLSGLKAPLWDYQADPYSGGSLAVGLLAAPLFRLLGPSVLALKLVPLAFALAVLVLSFLFLRRFFGLKSAVVGGLLLTLSPPAFSRLSLLAMGFHTESVVFGVAMLWPFYVFLFGEHRSRASLFLFGLSAGLGLSFTYITSLTAVACLWTWHRVDDTTLTRANLGTAFAGFALGSSPFIAYNLTHGLQGVKFALSFFVLPHSGHPTLWRLSGFFYSDLPLSLLFRKAWMGHLYTAAAAALSVAAAAAGRWKEPRLAFFSSYLVLFLAAYLLSGSRCEGLSLMDSRYLYPLYPILALFLAAVSERLRPPGRLLLVLLGFLGAAGQWETLFQEPFGRAARYKAYSYRLFGNQRGWDPRFTVGLQEPDRALYVWGALETTASMPQGADGPAAYAPFLWERRGAAAGCADIGLAVKNLEPGLRDYFVFGYFHDPTCFRAKLGLARADRRWYFFNRGLFGPTGDSPDASGAATDEDRRWLYRGFGRAAGIAVLEDGFSRGLLERVPRENLHDVFWGMGWEFRELYMYDPGRAVDRLEILPQEAWPAAIEGLRAQEAWYSF